MDTSISPSNLAQAIRQATRSLARSPGLSVIIIATLALGIGMATAVYSLVYAILLRPYPYRDPAALVRVQSVYVKQRGATQGCSLLDIEDFRRRAATIEDIGAFTDFETQLVGDGLSEVVAISQLNPAALEMLGVEPVVGRLFRTDEDRPGGDVHKALLSYPLWQQRFGGDPNIVGKVLDTDRLAYTIVGVMPPGFGFPHHTSFWTPMESYYAMLKDERAIKRRDSRFYATVARLKPGVTIEQAASDLNAIAATLEREYPKENDGVRVRLTRLREFEVGELQPYLRLVMAGVALVVLICCANVAGLLLVRATGLRRNLSIRAALGASRARLAGGLLLESVLLALTGGALGIALAYGIVQVILALIPVRLPFWMTVTVDRDVLAFSLLLSIATGIGFGVVPALQASRADLNDVLRQGSRGTGARSWLRSALVVGEVALSLVLLMCAALLMQMLLHLSHVETGFQSEGVLTARIVTFQPGTRQERNDALAIRHNRVLETVRQIPGIASVAITGNLPFTGTPGDRSQFYLTTKGREQETAKLMVPLSGADVSANYFETLRIPLRRGRLFDGSDTATSPFVVIINERGAKALFPDRDPIGQEILWGTQSPTNPYCRVVGVVENVRHHAAERENGIELYYPIAQWPIATSYYVVRTNVDPVSLGETIRRTIQAADSRFAVTEIKTMERRIGESLWEERLWSVMFSAFAVLALVLAAIGLYGLMAHSVVQRHREIGIRMALGAQPMGVRRMIVRDAMLLVLGGLILGAVGVRIVSGLIADLLKGLPTRDISTFLVVAAVLCATALLAAWLPAHRASRVDPLKALQAE